MRKERRHFLSITAKMNNSFISFTKEIDSTMHFVFSHISSASFKNRMSHCCLLSKFYSIFPILTQYWVIWTWPSFFFWLFSVEVRGIDKITTFSFMHHHFPFNISILFVNFIIASHISNRFGCKQSCRYCFKYIHLVKSNIVL